MSEDERDERHGRLGRLFAALVGTESGGSPRRRGRGSRPDGDGPRARARRRRRAWTSTRSRGRLASSPNPLLAPAPPRRRRARADRERRRPATAPSALETHLAERLQEAGVAGRRRGRDARELRVVRPRTSGLFYLRIDEDELRYAAKLRVLRVEAALNGALLATPRA